MGRDKALSAYREVVAMELRTSGHSYQDIADIVGFSDRSGAWRAVQRALKKKVVTAVDRYRMLRFAQAEAEHRQAWPAAQLGDFRAIDRCLRSLDERMSLMDLADD